MRDNPTVTLWQEASEEEQALLRHAKGSMAYFAKHSKSFRFAAQLFPPRQAEQVARVYAYCRFTDDLVDQAEGLSVRALQERLAHWQALSFRAYQGDRTEIALLDQVMGEMAREEVPFVYAAELIEGMRMDLEDRRDAGRVYPDLDALRLYSYRVAGVIGCWLTELFGVHDPDVLERAQALGHAMQLTNILRDVGEDLRNGRLYLPHDRLRAHGLTRRTLHRMLTGELPILPEYRKLLEELMQVAEEDYRLAFAAIPALPDFFQGPVAVAAYVYRGIHNALRRQKYDNIHQRAHTSLLQKLRYALQAQRDLRHL